MKDWQNALDQLYLEFKDPNEGKVADDIPELAKVDPNLFGLAVVTVDGQVFTAGDGEHVRRVHALCKKPRSFSPSLGGETLKAEATTRSLTIE